MTLADIEVQATAFQLGFLLQEHGARPLNDRQSKILARYVIELQCKIDDLGDERDEFEAKLKNMLEDHPKGCRCRGCVS